MMVCRDRIRWSLPSKAVESAINSSLSEENHFESEINEMLKNKTLEEIEFSDMENEPEETPLLLEVVSEPRTNPNHN